MFDVMLSKVVEAVLAKLKQLQYNVAKSDEDELIIQVIADQQYLNVAMRVDRDELLIGISHDAEHTRINYRLLVANQSIAVKKLARIVSNLEMYRSEYIGEVAITTSLKAMKWIVEGGKFSKIRTIDDAISFYLVEHIFEWCGSSNILSIYVSDNMACVHYEDMIVIANNHEVIAITNSGLNLAKDHIDLIVKMLENASND